MVEVKKISVAIGADHHGFALKEWLKQSFTCAGYEIQWHDCGSYDSARSDYPKFAELVSKEILNQTAVCGILLCATGVGMSIVANRFSGIRAGLAWVPEVAQRAKEEDAANLLVIPTDFVTVYIANQIICAWLQAQFKEGVYAQRLILIDKIT